MCFVFTESGLPLANEAIIDVAKSIKMKYLDLIKAVGRVQDNEVMSPGQVKIRCRNGELKIIYW